MNDNKLSTIIKLPVELTIAQVELFKQNVVELISTSQKELTIDDSGIVRIDTTGLQLILALIIHILSLHKDLKWQCGAECIIQGFKQLGMDEPILKQYIII